MLQILFLNIDSFIQSSQQHSGVGIIASTLQMRKLRLQLSDLDMTAEVAPPLKKRLVYPQALGEAGPTALEGLPNSGVVLKEASLRMRCWCETKGNAHRLNPLGAGFPLNFLQRWRIAVVQIIQKSLYLDFTMHSIFFLSFPPSFLPSALLSFRQIFLSNYIRLKLTLK